MQYSTALHDQDIKKVLPKGIKLISSEQLECDILQQNLLNDAIN